MSTASRNRLVVFVVFGFIPFFALPARAMDAELVFKKVAPSVVLIRDAEGFGSGVVLDASGLIITNFHVVNTPLPMEVLAEVSKGGKRVKEKLKVEKIVGIHPTYDMALIKVDPKVVRLFPIQKSSRALNTGENCFVIGNPSGAGGKALQNSITTGIISSAERTLEDKTYIQVSAQINPGNSGGALVDKNGMLIGVVTFKIDQAEGLGFAIPMSTYNQTDFKTVAERKVNKELSRQYAKAGGEYYDLSRRATGEDKELAIYLAYLCYRKPTIPRTGIPADAPERVKVLVEDLYSWKPHRRAEAAKKLGDMGEAAGPAAPFLRAMIGDSVHFERYGFRLSVAGYPGKDAAVALLKIDPAAAGKLIELLDDKAPDGKDRHAMTNAALGLALERKAEAIPRLLEFLKKDDRDVRLLGAYTLGRMGHSASTDAFAKLLEEKDGAFRARVAAAAGDAGVRTMTPALVKLLGEKDGAVRSQAAWGLRMMKDPDATKPLIETLKDDEPWIRAQAADGLGLLEAESAVDALCEALEKDRDPYVRDRAARALWRIGDIKTIPLLREKLEDPDEGVRWSARLALASMTFSPTGGLPGGIGAMNIDKVVRRVADTGREGVEWIVYERKFVARAEKDALRNFLGFMRAREYDSIKVNGLHFMEDSVWAATDKGAFRYERKAGAWVEYAVKREHIGVPVTSIRPDDDGNLVFAVVVDGKNIECTFDTETGTWK